VETPEEVADTIGRALQFVPREHLIACTNCGLAPMPRAVAEAKLAALAQGAALARRYASRRRPRPPTRSLRLVPPPAGSSPTPNGSGA
jgi:hypothetical protein